VAALALPGCTPPNLSGLSPDSGPPRTLVQVSGQTFLASTRWDAGSPGETTLTGGFLGAYMFSVPANATPGAHNVQLVVNGSGGNVLPFTVTGSQPFGAPRLDRVSLVGAEFPAAGTVRTWLMVQGANVDVGAEVLVDGVVQPTFSYKALRNDLLGVAPGTLGNPLYHHLALIASPGDRPAGSSLNVTIRNLDNQVSNVVSYALPATQAALDSDGDDIPDDWEMNGYDADSDGIIDVDLPGLGADRYRPDVLLEVDVMQGLANPPAAAAFQAMRDAYAAAPFINIGTDGINLILDTSGSVPFSQSIDLQGTTNPTTGFTNFYTLKGANFDNAARGRLYYYCIWANARPNGSSGVSDPSLNAAQTDFAGPGDDCIVSFDDFSAAFQTVRSGAETLMHEVGHNFQQRHGGATHFANTPNYNSVMSYNWQLRTGVSSATRIARPVCLPFYYGAAGATEVAGALPATVGTVIDYSDGMGANLVELALNESAGVCNNVAVNWDGDGNPAEASVSADINGGGASSTLTDFANWANLVFGGPRLNGGSGP
jgi:hypothetical protein